MNATSALPVRILTHNIRYATTHPFPGEAPWHVRCPHLISELRFHTLHTPTSFICLQEVLKTQLDDILHGLNNPSTPFLARPPTATAHQPLPLSPLDDDGDRRECATDTQREWSYVGVARENGGSKGEYNPILYRSSIWRLHWSTTCWLSPTPETPSKGWDAASPRIVTTGLFEHRATGRRVLALNTHLDDQGRKARVEGAKLILRWIQEHLDNLRLAAGGTGQPAVFLTGDLNSETSGFDAYTIFNHASSPVRDVRDLVPEDQWYGHWDTFTGFDDGESEPKKRIDFIFVGKEGARWMPVMYGVLGNRARGLYVSDHRAVVADALLGAGEC